MTHSTEEPAFAKLAQIKLADLGLYKGVIDGIFGPVSESAYQAWKTSPAAITDPNQAVPAWPNILHAMDGIYTSGIATWFGGDADPDDDGSTASGVNTFDPSTQGCALPLPRNNFVPTAGTQLPDMTWGTKVEVSANGKKITIPVIDLGPNQTLPEKRPIDLCRQSFLDLGGDLNAGRLQVSIRILI